MQNRTLLYVAIECNKVKYVEYLMKLSLENNVPLEILMSRREILEKKIEGETDKEQHKRINSRDSRNPKIENDQHYPLTLTIHLDNERERENREHAYALSPVRLGKCEEAGSKGKR